MPPGRLRIGKSRKTNKIPVMHHCRNRAKEAPFGINKVYRRFTDSQYMQPPYPHRKTGRPSRPPGSWYHYLELRLLNTAHLRR